MKYYWALSLLVQNERAALLTKSSLVRVVGATPDPEKNSMGADCSTEDHSQHKFYLLYETPRPSATKSHREGVLFVNKRRSRLILTIKLSGSSQLWFHHCAVHLALLVSLERSGK